MGLELIRQYLNRNKYKALPKEEMFTLVTKAQNGDNEAKNRLIECNMPLVIQHAARHLWAIDSVMGFEDLFQEGILGLKRAIEKFDINQDLSLSTYATFWINQRIERFIQDNHGPVRIPIYLQELKNKYAKLKKDDQALHNDDFYLRLVANENESTITNLRRAISNVPSGSSIDRKNEYGKETFQLESIVDENQINLDHLDFQSMINLLGGDEKTILESRMTGWSLAQIATIYGLSRERIRQIEASALLKLRALLADVKTSGIFEIREKLAKEFEEHKAKLEEQEFRRIETSEKYCRILGVCEDCLNKALKIIENTGKKQSGRINWVMSECDVCHGIKLCAKPGDFNFPVFYVKVFKED